MGERKESGMATLLIRDVDEAVHAALERRAVAHGRSVEDEAREVLRLGAGRETISQIAIRYFGPENGVDLDLPPRRDDLERPPPDFSGPDFAAFDSLHNEPPP